MSGPATPRVVLVIGAGGREHALAWRLSREVGVERVLVAPGNPLMADVAHVVAHVGPTDQRAVIELCRSEGVELVVVGPEAPLVAGLADALAAAGVPCLGPSARTAALEGSKSHCRDVASAAGVAMAEGRSFDDHATALAYAGGLGGRLVVKADGLAAGKGVSVCDSPAEAANALAEAMLDGRHGAAGRRVVVERRLEGREASLIALCDATSALLLPAARDHKRLTDDDRGPNTGGMGAYSPLADLPDEQALALLAAIHRPVLAEMARRGTPFRGFLYAGLMLTDDGPRLLEFNVRLGDPEAQAILPLIDAPLASLMLAAARDGLAEAALELGLDRLLPARGAAVALTLAAAGYPAAPRSGDPIAGLREAQAAGGLVFGAGLGLDGNGRLVTAGGRVLTVVGVGAGLPDARRTAYAAAEQVRFEGRQLRSDIGADVAAEVAIA